MPLVDSECQTDDYQPLLGSQYSSSSFTSKSTIYHSEGIHQFSSIKAVWMSKRVRKCLFLFFTLAAFGVLGMMYAGHYFPSATLKISGQTKGNLPALDNLLLSLDQPGRPLSETHRSDSNPSYEDVVAKDFQFDISGHDVMVFLHIQKTGGTTFGRHLVRDLDLQRGCQCHSKVRKRCTCLRPGPHSTETWLFSRYSTGWQCGLHADWTELTACVDDTMNDIEASNIRRKYFYITFLRDPVHRFLSEFRHVGRGATWKNARLACGGRPATREEIGSCYEGEVWDHPTLEEFMDCPHNLAINRQTRMLADLLLVGCYNKSVMSPAKRDELMLWSAKGNLNRMAFFGLTEEQEKSQYLFEEIFNLRFSVRFEQYNKTAADASLSSLSPAVIARIRKLNHLDEQLYSYAKELLKLRFQRLSSQDRHFNEHFSGMGRSNFSWDALENGN